MRSNMGDPPLSFLSPPHDPFAHKPHLQARLKALQISEPRHRDPLATLTPGNLAFVPELTPGVYIYIRRDMKKKL